MYFGSVISAVRGKGIKEPAPHACNMPPVAPEKNGVTDRPRGVERGQKRAGGPRKPTERNRCRRRADD